MAGFVLVNRLIWLITWRMKFGMARDMRVNNPIDPMSRRRMDVKQWQTQEKQQNRYD
jgi:hypothetical protein